MRAWTPDADGDGYGVGEAEILSCDAPEGHAAVAGDCDDTDASVHPGAPVDVCDDVDNDCDGEVDEDPDRLWYADLDGDGFGVTDAPALGCEPGEDRAPVDGDCDDDDAYVHPEAAERCNGVDDDCDGGIDDEDGDAIDPATWYPDLDGDGYGASVSWEGCDPGSGWVTLTGDCRDTDAMVFPGADEVCDNGRDDDCDDQIDEVDSCV